VQFCGFGSNNSLAQWSVKLIVQQPSSGVERELGVAMGQPIRLFLTNHRDAVSIVSSLLVLLQFLHFYLCPRFFEVLGVASKFKIFT